MLAGNFEKAWRLIWNETEFLTENTMEIEDSDLSSDDNAIICPPNNSDLSSDDNAIICSPYNNNK